MNAAITTLQIALSEAKANLLKIKKNPDIFPVASISQLSEGIRQYRKAISILSGCDLCKKIADNPIFFCDRAICQECVEKLKKINPFGMGK